jgi:hypothetical protein
MLINPYFIIVVSENNFTYSVCNQEDNAPLDLIIIVVCHCKMRCIETCIFLANRRRKELVGDN